LRAVKKSKLGKRKKEPAAGDSVGGTDKDISPIKFSRRKRRISKKGWSEYLGGSKKKGILRESRIEGREVSTVSKNEEKTALSFLV